MKIAGFFLFCLVFGITYSIYLKVYGYLLVYHFDVISPIRITSRAHLSKNIQLAPQTDLYMQLCMVQL